MRNFQRILAVTLVTTITSTTIASTKAWAEDDAYFVLDQPAQVQYKERQVIERDASRTENRKYVVRDDSADLTCTKYQGMDQNVLQSQYGELQRDHYKRIAMQPAESAGIGFGAYALATKVLHIASFHWLGALLVAGAAYAYQYFHSGKNESDRKLNALKTEATIDHEALELRCMKNELEKRKNYGYVVYGNAIPTEMPAGVSASAGGKIASDSSTCQYNGSCGSVPADTGGSAVVSGSVGVTTDSSRGGSSTGSAGGNSSYQTHGDIGAGPFYNESSSSSGSSSTTQQQSGQRSSDTGCFF